MKKSRNIEINQSSLTDSDILSFKESFSSLLKRFSQLPPQGPSFSSGTGGTTKASGGFFNGSSLSIIAGVVTISVATIIGVLTFSDKNSPMANETVVVSDSLIADSDEPQRTIATQFPEKEKSEKLSNNNMANEKVVESDSPVTDSHEPKRAIAPPFPELLNPEKHAIDNSTDTMIISKKGSKIFIPANAFVSKDGKPVSGKVKLKWEEYQNPVEVWLSGIPMEYDSSGTQYTFQTAGMFSIKASAEKEPLLLADNKNIDIVLQSEQDGRFNIYYYDTLENAWNFLNRDNKPTNQFFEKPIRTVEANDHTYNTEERTRSMVKPLIVRPRNEEKFVTALDLPADTFPEFSDVKDLMFEISVDGKDNEYINQLFEITWTKMDLKKPENDNRYEIHLSNWDTTLVVDATPVTSPEEYALLESDYKAKLKAEQEQRAAQRRERLAAQNIRNQAGTSFTRRISISVLGIYNYDKPFPGPLNPRELDVFFADKSDSVLNYSSVNLLTGNRDIFWRYNRQEKKYYTRNSQTLLWFVTRNNQLAIMNPERFDKPKGRITPTIYKPEEGIKIIDGFYQNGTSL